MLGKCRSRANIIFAGTLSLAPPSFPINFRVSGHISKWLNSVIHNMFPHLREEKKNVWQFLRLLLKPRSTCIWGIFIFFFFLCITTNRVSESKQHSILFFIFIDFFPVVNATFECLYPDEYSVYLVINQVTKWLFAGFSARNYIIPALNGGKNCLFVCLFVFCMGFCVLSVQKHCSSYSCAAVTEMTCFIC